MTIALNIPGITSRNDESRVDHGIGQVRERTFTIGRTVISVANIGSMSVIDQPRSVALGILSGIVALWCGMGILSSMSGPLNQMLIPLLLPTAAIAGFIAYRCLFGETDIYLSIGTCDGYRMNLVSKNRTFLETIRDYLCRKIETPNDTTAATLNISKAQFRIYSGGGGVNIGSDGVAAGSGGAARRQGAI